MVSYVRLVVSVRSRLLVLRQQYNTSTRTRIGYQVPSTVVYTMAPSDASCLVFILLTVSPTNAFFSTRREHAGRRIVV